MAKQKEKTCFIIMPLSTPDPFKETYKDGVDHFHHVLEGLFIPAIESAGFTPIKPIAEGADLIHAEIVKNLDESDLVFCDLSTLNPNVFFEYGIRTALNKSVCIVKDQFTQNIPFDTAIINYWEYNANIEVWNITKQISDVKEHIMKSEKRNNGINSLWKYFGINREAIILEGELSASDKMDYLIAKVEELSRTKISQQKNQFGETLARESFIIDDGRIEKSPNRKNEIFLIELLNRSNIFKIDTNNSIEDVKIDHNDRRIRIYPRYKIQKEPYDILISTLKNIAQRLFKDYDLLLMKSIEELENDKT